MGWFTEHWPELLFALIVILVVKGDALFELLKGGRKARRDATDQEVERRVAPLRERAESAERLSQTYHAELVEVRGQLSECNTDRAQLQRENEQLRKTVGELAPLQPDVLRIRGEMQELEQRLERVERRYK